MWTLIFVPIDWELCVICLYKDVLLNSVYRAVRMLCKLIKMYFGIIEATTANGTTAFGNWTETSDPGRALVFSWSCRTGLHFLWNYLDTPSHFLTVHCAEYSFLCQPSHIFFLIETFCNKLSRLYPSKFYHREGKNATVITEWRKHFFQCTATLQQN